MILFSSMTYLIIIVCEQLCFEASYPREDYRISSSIPSIIMCSYIKKPEKKGGNKLQVCSND